MDCRVFPTLNCPKVSIDFSFPILSLGVTDCYATASFPSSLLLEHHRRTSTLLSLTCRVADKHFKYTPTSGLRLCKLGRVSPLVSPAQA